MSAGVDNSDVLAMKKLIETFGTDTNMAICVTRSENMSPLERKKIIDELEQHQEMGDLIKQVKSNIFFMGAVDPDKINDEGTLQKVVDKVMEDRGNFLEFIFLCNNDTKIEDLKFVSDKRAEIKKKIQLKQQTVTALILTNNLDDDAQQKVKNCQLEADSLRHLVSLFDTDCLELYAKFARDMDDLTSKLGKRGENQND